MSTLRRWLQRLVRGVLRFAYPDYEETSRRLATLDRTLGALEKQVRSARRDQSAALEGVARAIERAPTRRDLEQLTHDVAHTRRLFDRQARVTARLLRRGDARGEPSRDERRALQRLERIAAGSGPIVVGPWMGEVGFELLYWIPFVAWFKQRFEVDSNRLIVVSRGGASPWYAHVAHRYVELLSLVSLEEFRNATEQSKKQRGVTRFDRVALRRVLRRETLGRVRLLHPQLMYRLYWEFWKGRAPAHRVRQYADHAPFRLSGRERPAGLPASYVAARFYFSNAFPDTAENRAFVADVLGALAEVSEVVLLNTPFRVDDHHDFDTRVHPRIHAVGEMPPERNLAIQTAIIQGATAFVGTYGGYAYLAPLCGVPSVAFYSTDAFFRHHLDLAQQVGHDLGLPSLVALDTRDAGVLRAVLSRTRAALPGHGVKAGAMNP
jgi:hypothetical protein